MLNEIVQVVVAALVTEIIANTTWVASRKALDTLQKRLEKKKQKVISRRTNHG